MLSKNKSIDIIGDISLAGPKLGINYHNTFTIKNQHEKIEILRQFLTDNDLIGSGIESKSYHERVLNAKRIILPEKLVKESTLDDYKKFVLWVEETPKVTTVLLENCQKDTNYCSMSMYSALALIISQMGLDLNIEGVSNNFSYNENISPVTNEMLNKPISTFFKEYGATILSPRQIKSLYRMRMCGHTRLKNGFYLRGKNSYCYATINYPIYIAESESNELDNKTKFYC